MCFDLEIITNRDPKSQILFNLLAVLFVCIQGLAVARQTRGHYESLLYSPSYESLITNRFRGYTRVGLVLAAIPSDPSNAIGLITQTDYDRLELKHPEFRRITLALHLWSSGFKAICVLSPREPHVIPERAMAERGTSRTVGNLPTTSEKILLLTTPGENDSKEISVEAMVLPDKAEAFLNFCVPSRPWEMR